MKTRHTSWGRVLALALGGAPLVAGAQAPRAEASTAHVQGGVRYVVGETTSWRFTLHATLEWDASQMLAQLEGQPSGPVRLVRGAVERSGVLSFRVVEATQAGAWAVARLDEGRFSLDGQRDERTGALGAPFLVRFGADGQVLETSFARGTPTAIADGLRGVVEALRVVVPVDAGAQWTAIERSGEVVTRALYQRRGDTVHKETVAVLPVSTTGASGAGALQGRFEASGTRITLDAARGTPTRVEGRERLGVQRLGRQVSVTDSAFTAEVELAAAPVVPLPASLEEARQQQARLAATWSPQEAQDATVRPLTATTAAAVLSELEAALKRNLAEGIASYRAWVRAHPAELPMLGRQLAALEGSANSTTLAAGWAGLAMVGTAPAQAVLRDAIEGSTASPAAKERAVVSLLNLTAPEPRTVAAVWRLREATLRAAQPNPSLLSVCANAYGAMGDVAFGLPAVTAEVERTLTARLAATPDVLERDAMLSALGNVGDAALLPAIRPHFDAAASSTRERAFRALQRLPAALAMPEFQARFAVERDLEVRRAAARTARAMTPAPEVLAWATAQLPAEADAETAMALIDLLGGVLHEHPENAAVLRQKLSTSTDRKVRRALYSYVSPEVSR